MQGHIYLRIGINVTFIGNRKPPSYFFNVLNHWLVSLPKPLQLQNLQAQRASTESRLRLSRNNHCTQLLKLFCVTTKFY